MGNMKLRITLGIVLFILLVLAFFIGDYLVHGNFKHPQSTIIFVCICGFIALFLAFINLKLWAILFSTGFIVGTVRMSQINWKFTITHKPNMSGAFAFMEWILAGFILGGLLQLMIYLLKKSE